MQTFCGLSESSWDIPQDTRAVLFGAPEATPYEPGTPSHAGEAPAAIRAVMAKYADWHAHHDFDFDSVALRDIARHVVDCGDLSGSAETPEANRSGIEQATKTVLQSGARPVVVGGDDSVPIPFLNAFEGHGPVWVVQVDAHIDWKHKRFGEPLGWSSNMRRASEMPWVAGITQIGIRGIGSAVTQDVEDALKWGAQIVTAREVHTKGIAAALSSIPAGSRCVIALDVDGLDPAVMPGVLAQAPGGLTYYQMLEIIEVVREQHTLAGFSLVELVPRLDLNGVSALTAGRILVAALHAMTVE